MVDVVVVVSLCLPVAVGVAEVVAVGVAPVAAHVGLSGSRFCSVSFSRCGRGWCLVVAAVVVKVVVVAVTVVVVVDSGAGGLGFITQHGCQWRALPPSWLSSHSPPPTRYAWVWTARHE